MEHVAINLTEKEISMATSAVRNAKVEAAALEQEKRPFEEMLGMTRAGVTSLKGKLLEIQSEDMEKGMISMSVEEWEVIRRAIELILQEMTAVELEVRTTYLREEYEELDGKLATHICR